MPITCQISILKRISFRPLLDIMAVKCVSWSKEMIASNSSGALFSVLVLINHSVSKAQPRISVHSLSGHICSPPGLPVSLSLANYDQGICHRVFPVFVSVAGRQNHFIGCQQPIKQAYRFYTSDGVKGLCLDLAHFCFVEIAP